MSSTFFSTTCYIKKELHRLRMCIDDDCNKYSGSSIDDILLTIETDESTSSIANIQCSIRFYFELLTEKKSKSDDDNNDIVPKEILLSKLLNIKHSVTSSNEMKSLSIAHESSKNSEIHSSQVTHVDLSYVDISESFLWRIKRIQLEMNDTIAQHLCLISNRFLSTLKHRPRHLLVFINPKCGKDKGCSVYEKSVLPLFEEAQINAETIYTERANHAQDYIHRKSLDNYDGLISVGGDGMFSELCHSLLLKTTRQAGLNIDDSTVQLKRPNLRIGVIPAGSTDAVAFGTTGHNDPITNALQIIVGESLLIDIAIVHSERGFVRFMATMLAYGFFGNIIRQSNHWRIFGPLRYTLTGIFQFIRNTSYPTALTIVQAPKQHSAKSVSDDYNQHQSENSIKRPEISAEHSEEKSLRFEIKREGRYRSINCLNMACRCEQSRYGMSPSVHLSDGSFDLILVTRSWYLDFFRFLHHVAEDGRTIGELPNVERFRAREVVIRPMMTKEKERGNWACDGELIKANEVRVRAHHQLLNLFASGIHLDQIKKINDEDSKTIRLSLIQESEWTRRLFLFSLILLFVFFIYNYLFLL